MATKTTTIPATTLSATTTSTPSRITYNGKNISLEYIKEHPRVTYGELRKTFGGAGNEPEAPVIKEYLSPDEQARLDRLKKEAEDIKNKAKESQGKFGGVPESKLLEIRRLEQKKLALASGTYGVSQVGGQGVEGIQKRYSEQQESYNKYQIETFQKEYPQEKIVFGKGGEVTGITSEFFGGTPSRVSINGTTISKEYIKEHPTVTPAGLKTYAGSYNLGRTFTPEEYEKKINEYDEQVSKDIGVEIPATETSVRFVDWFEKLGSSKIKKDRTFIPEQTPVGRYIKEFDKIIIGSTESTIRGFGRISGETFNLLNLRTFSGTKMRIPKSFLLKTGTPEDVETSTIISGTILAEMTPLAPYVSAYWGLKGLEQFKLGIKEKTPEGYAQATVGVLMTLPMIKLMRESGMTTKARIPTIEESTLSSEKIALSRKRGAFLPEVINKEGKSLGYVLGIDREGKAISIGGFIEPKETMRAGTLREVFEETGLKLKDIKDFQEFSKFYTPEESHNIFTGKISESVYKRLKARSDVSRFELFKPEIFKDVLGTTMENPRSVFVTSEFKSLFGIGTNVRIDEAIILGRIEKLKEINLKIKSMNYATKVVFEKEAQVSLISEFGKKRLGGYMSKDFLRDYFLMRENLLPKREGIQTPKGNLFLFSGSRFNVEGFEQQKVFSAKEMKNMYKNYGKGFTSERLTISGYFEPNKEMLKITQRLGKKEFKQPQLLVHGAMESPILTNGKLMVKPELSKRGGAGFYFQLPIEKGGAGYVGLSYVLGGGKEYSFSLLPDFARRRQILYTRSVLDETTFKLGKKLRKQRLSTKQIQKQLNIKSPLGTIGATEKSVKGIEVESAMFRGGFNIRKMGIIYIEGKLIYISQLKRIISKEQLMKLESNRINIIQERWNKRAGLFQLDNEKRMITKGSQYYDEKTGTWKTYEIPTGYSRNIMRIQESFYQREQWGKKGIMFLKRDFDILTPKRIMELKSLESRYKNINVQKISLLEKSGYRLTKEKYSIFEKYSKEKYFGERLKEFPRKYKEPYKKLYKPSYTYNYYNYPKPPRETPPEYTPPYNPPYTPPPSRRRKKLFGEEYIPRKKSLFKTYKGKEDLAIVEGFISKTLGRKRYIKEKDLLKAVKEYSSPLALRERPIIIK